MSASELSATPDPRYRDAEMSTPELRRHIGTYKHFIHGIWSIAAVIATILVLLAYFVG